MHSESYPQLVSLVILFPAIGAFINLFWGAKLTEKGISAIATIASSLAFVVAMLLLSYLVNNNYQAVVVNPPLLDSWIRIGDSVVIPWQQRVDTLSVLMMTFITGIGSLIHMYASSYMHGDPRYHRFFAYLNMFLAFMLILVTGNNFLMMFVGWEGVGLCSFLLIGFWFDKKKGVGWRNSNAARKAFIVNRIGDFGVLMAVFLIFWTFGTLDYYRPGEIANVEFAQGGAHHGEEGDHSEGAVAGDHSEGAAAEGEHSEAAPAAEGEHSEAAPVAEGGAGAVAEGEHSEAAAAEGDHSEGAAVADGEGDHAEEGHGEAAVVYTDNEHIPTDQLGVFGKTERWLAEGGHTVDFGPYNLPLEQVLVIITLFMLLGAAGKSAQIPLFVWLPDAMAGPTPVSALIHAATMVTAGVYMMVRSNVWFYEAEVTSLIVTIVGASTALVAGFIAIGQWDIKRVLAFSTVSQLGFMVAAVGVGAYTAAMFHLFTHAFFKALLFLGSGSVIHGVEHGHHLAHGHGHGHDDHDAHAQHDPHADPHDAHTHDEHHEEEEEFDAQDMRNMGGLWRRMPVTYLTYVIGTLALAGIFPFAGFWSKDEILADSWVVGFEDGELRGYIALGLLLIAAAFTAYYMWRQIELVFHGQPRTEAARKAPESSIVMVLPLVILAIFSIFAGFFNTPSNVLGLDTIFGAHRFNDFLYVSVVHAHAAEFNLILAVVATALAIGAIFLARSIYGGANPLRHENQVDPVAENPVFGRAWSLANARLYWDQTYYRLFEGPFNRIGSFLANTVDQRFWHDYFHNTIIRDGFDAIGRLLSNPVDLGIIDGVVNGIGRLTRWVSGSVRGIQTGYVRTYAITLLLGVVIVIVVLLLPLLQTNG
jgi:NADH-quinone oxidoreductase subunit L